MNYLSSDIFTAPNGMEYYRFSIFEGHPLQTLFTTRKGGVSTGCYESLNFGFSSGDEEAAVKENYRRLAECLHTDLSHLVTAAQTHTSNVRIVTAEDAGMGVTRPRDFQDIDGLVTDVPGIGLITAHADCTPVQFFDPVKKVIGAAHSGWSGTLKNISRSMISIMSSHYGCDPKTILVAIGPSLCQDCFEVDEDVAQMFLQADPSYKALMYRKGIKTYIDLRRIIEQELLAEGVLSNHIECSPLCTKCNPKLFFSHRNMGTKRGVMASAMVLTES